jgi:hypothetical protein
MKGWNLLKTIPALRFTENKFHWCNKQQQSSSRSWKFSAADIKVYFSSPRFTFPSRIFVLSSGRFDRGISTTVLYIARLPIQVDVLTQVSPLQFCIFPGFPFKWPFWQKYLHYSSVYFQASYSSGRFDRGISTTVLYIPRLSVQVAVLTEVSPLQFCIFPGFLFLAALLTEKTNRYSSKFMLIVDLLHVCSGRFHNSSVILNR